MFSLESPHRGDSNENSQYTIYNMNKRNTLNYPKSAALGYFPRDSRASSKQPSVFEPLKFYCTTKDKIHKSPVIQSASPHIELFH